MSSTIRMDKLLLSRLDRYLPWVIDLLLAFFLHSPNSGNCGSAPDMGAESLQGRAAQYALMKAFT